ncbi:MAG: glutamine amidotransferase [Armatimonadota bacterium]
MTTMRTLIFVLLAATLPAALVGAEEMTAAINIYNQTKTAEILVKPDTMVFDKGRLVQDPDARTGWAIRADPQDKPGEGYLWYGYSYGEGPGKIRVTYRLKVADNTSPHSVVDVQVFMNDHDLAVEPGRFEAIRGTDFRAPNTYQDFSFELTKGESGFGGWGLFAKGVTAVTWDGLIVEQLTRFTPSELLAVIKKPVRPQTLALKSMPFRIHETYGLYMPLWKIKEAAMLLGIARTQSSLNVHPQKTALAGFPDKWEELYAYGAVVLNNVPAKAVGLSACMMLKQYVEDGGCVVLLGDTHSLSAGLWADSPLGPLLPVTLGKGHDRKLPAKPLYLTPRGKLFRALRWADKPYTVYYHQATVCPKAQVLLSAGDIPLIVEGTVGKGRIVVVLASVLGEVNPKVKGVPFWEWSLWPALMIELLDSLRAQ